MAQWMLKLELDGSLHDFPFEEREQVLATAYALKQEFRDRLANVLVIAPQGQTTQIFARSGVNSTPVRTLPLS
ncbi:MAG TPA: hypothetical protein VHZ07_07165 [Bryobacteraceae bacterium]|jgi:hypothetical protein|nr:hypothetical protein [Bryobacteraceae bacterium]